MKSLAVDLNTMRQIVYSNRKIIVIEQQLRQVGNELSQFFPTQIHQLLSLLDKVENLLAAVEQSPLELMQNAYAQCMKALLDEQLFRHTDADVQVAVASCINECIRITTPEVPFSDDQMKEVFQLIVSSFANLSDMSSRSYDKRASILETVAKIKLCVIMLDLECNGLILEMFQHFLSSIRDYHPEKIFRSMETIMTLVLEESDKVPLELLTPILASLEKNNEEIPTSARKLGENVFANCAVKLKPYAGQAVKSLGLSLDAYSEIVATICNGSNGEVEHNNGNVSLQKAKPKAAEWMRKPFRHYDEMVAMYKSGRAAGETAGAPSKMRQHLTTEDIQTETDDSASSENAPESGTKSQSQSQTSTSKSTTKSKNDNEPSSKLDESIGILARAFKDMVDSRKLPITVDELWGFIHEMRLDEDLAGDAFVFLLERPVQVKGLMATPIHIRKSILMKMMRDAKK